MFFRQRWHPLPRMLGSWQQAYAGKVLAAKGYADRYCTDSLFGHGGAVRACCLVPACNAIVTGIATTRSAQYSSCCTLHTCTFQLQPCESAVGASRHSRLCCRVRGPDSAAVGS